MNDQHVEQTDKLQYLACEHRSVFLLLMINSGMMGAYTFNLRGGVFCNAQTANVVMMAVALGSGDLKGGLYYLIPITAYAFGAFISEILPSPIKRLGVFRWDTCLIAIEMLVLLIIGFLPLTLPHQIVQITVNFIASMQYNTFRQAEGVPMATTFCTNHVRQVGIALAKIVKDKNYEQKNKALLHIKMVTGFMLGGMVLTIFCKYFMEKAIWIALVPLGIILVQLVYADLKTEHHLLSQKPCGH